VVHAHGGISQDAGHGKQDAYCRSFGTVVNGLSPAAYSGVVAVVEHVEGEGSRSAIYTDGVALDFKALIIRTGVVPFNIYMCLGPSYLEDL
jgi:hypothetical protein